MRTPNDLVWGLECLPQESPIALGGSDEVMCTDVLGECVTKNKS